MPKYWKKYGRGYYKRKWRKAYTRRSLRRHLAFGKSTGEVQASCTVHHVFNIDVPAYSTLSTTKATFCPGYSNLIGNGEIGIVRLGLCGLYDSYEMRKLIASYGSFKVRGMYLQLRLAAYESSSAGSAASSVGFRPYVYWDRSATHNSVNANTLGPREIKSIAAGSGGIPFYKYSDHNYYFKCLPENSAERDSWLNTRTFIANAVSAGTDGTSAYRYQYFYLTDYFTQNTVQQTVFLPCAICCFEMDNYSTVDRDLQVVAEVKYYVSFRNPGTAEQADSALDHLLKDDDDLRPEITV